MATTPGWRERESALVSTICKPYNCVYEATHDDGEHYCSVKYSDQVVYDFDTDGCAVAAQYDQKNPFSIRPGEMTRQGFIPFDQKPVTSEFHRRNLKSDPNVSNGCHLIFKR